MARLLDTNLWIALTRTGTPQELKQLVSPYAIDPQACLAEPVVFEMLRNATEAETLRLATYFESLLLLATPPDIWSDGVELGRACRRIGVSVGAIDLLIAVVAIYHDAEVVTFDRDFEHIAKVSELRVKFLQRP